MTSFSPSLTQLLERLVLAEYPREAGAVLIKGQLYPVRNTSPTPTEAMRFSGEDLTRLELQHGPIEACIHSHPYDPLKVAHDQRRRPEWASTRDMEMWIEWGIPFGIIATDGQGCSPVLWYDDKARPPLLGREFIHGYTDCYDIVRDYYRAELGIALPNFPRGWDWWNVGLNLYEEGFPKAGFVEIPRAEARRHDVLLYQIGTPRPNHAAVLLSDSTIAHHLIDRLSCAETRTRWTRCEHKALRHQSLAATEADPVATPNT